MTTDSNSDITTVVADYTALANVGRLLFWSRQNTNFVLPRSILGDVNKRRDESEGYYSAYDYFKKNLRGLMSKEGISVAGSNTVRIVNTPARNPNSFIYDVIALAKDLERQDDISRVEIVTNDLLVQADAYNTGIAYSGFEESKVNPISASFDINAVDFPDGTKDDNCILDTIAIISEERGIDVPGNAVVRVRDYSRNVTLLKHGDKLIKLNKDNVDEDGTLRIGKFSLNTPDEDQLVLLNYLLDTSIPEVSVGGKAGSGKSITALAAALYMLHNDSTYHYDHIVVVRPVVGADEQNIGLLPGTKDEKMAEWAVPIWKNIGKIESSSAAVAATRHRGNVEVQPSYFMRGDTIDNAIIIVDDAQNFRYDDLHTIATRVGQNSKLITTHDWRQIDNSAVTASNGILRMVENNLHEKLFAYCTLGTVHRSKVAAMHERNY